MLGLVRGGDPRGQVAGMGRRRKEVDGERHGDYGGGGASEEGEELELYRGGWLVYVACHCFMGEGANRGRKRTHIFIVGIFRPHDGHVVGSRLAALRTRNGRTITARMRFLFLLFLFSFSFNQASWERRRSNQVAVKTWPIRKKKRLLAKEFVVEEKKKKEGRRKRNTEQTNEEARVRQGILYCGSVSDASDASAASATMQVHN